MPSAAITSTMQRLTTSKPSVGPYWSARARRLRARRAPSARRRTRGGKVEVSGRPPASEITSARSVSAIRSRIAEDFITFVRCGEQARVALEVARSSSAAVEPMRRRLRRGRRGFLGRVVYRHAASTLPHRGRSFLAITQGIGLALAVRACGRSCPRCSPARSPRADLGVDFERHRLRVPRAARGSCSPCVVLLVVARGARAPRGPARSTRGAGRRRASAASRSASARCCSPARWPTHGDLAGRACSAGLACAALGQARPRAAVCAGAARSASTPTRARAPCRSTPTARRSCSPALAVAAAAASSIVALVLLRRGCCSRGRRRGGREVRRACASCGDRERRCRASSSSA